MSVPMLLLVAAVVVLLLVVVWLLLERQRSGRLRSRFGSEYDRAVEREGGRRRAEAELADRERRVATLDIRPLDDRERERFAAAWRQTQARFVDDPTGAIHEADDLIGQVMAARGYPVADFEQRAGDVSVHHADVVEHYRVAHDIATASNGNMPADTEALRQAMVHYRALFASLLEVQRPSPVTRSAADEARSAVDATRRTTTPADATPQRADALAPPLPPAEESLASRRTS